MRGNAELERGGGRRSQAPRPCSSAPSTSARVLEEVVGHVERVHEVPPGVDVDAVHAPAARGRRCATCSPRPRPIRRTPATRNERLPDEGNAERLAAFFAGDRPTVLYFGKLLLNKGVHVLLEAMRDLDARVLIVGFGDYREELERARGRPRDLFTGPLEHRHLVHLIPLADVTVVPSIFPEAFGMVAAEAAAGRLAPARGAALGAGRGRRRARGGVPARAPRGSRASPPATQPTSRASSTPCSRSPEPERERLRRAARQAAVERWSWAGVAERLLAPFA